MISLLSSIQAKENLKEEIVLTDETLALRLSFLNPKISPFIERNEQQNIPKLLDQFQQQPLGLCLGFFDGFHLAHQALVEALHEHCLKEKCVPALFTFDQKPRENLVHLQSLEERLASFEKAGVVYTFVQTFNDTFKSLSPEVFVKKILVEVLNAKLIVVGYDFTFGKDGKAKVSDLEQLCQAYGIKCVVLPPVYYGGQVVHSTALRQMLSEGRLEDYVAFSGKAYVVKGKVIQGQQLGRKLDFSTANLVYGEGLPQLPYGVYYSYTQVGKVRYFSISNLGLRPSIQEQEKQLLLETYIYDFEQDLYGMPIEVELLAFVRPEQKFESLEALKTQVLQDKANGLIWHENRKEAYLKAKIGDIEVYHVPSTDFVTNYFNIELAFPYEKEKHAARQVLFEYLTSLNASCENTLAFNRRLESFYGAALDLKYKRVQGQSIYQLYGQALRQAPDGQSSFKLLFNEALNCLLYPKREAEGNFVKHIYEKELENFKEAFEERKNNAELQIQEDAFRHLYELLSQSLEDREKIFLEAYLRPERLEDYQHFSEEALEQAYHEALALSKIKVYISGKYTSQDFEDFFQKLALFPQNLKRQSFHKRYTRPLSPLRATNLVSQTYETPIAQAQSYLHLFYKVDLDFSSYKSFYMNFFNLLLGGDTYSALFKTLREEKHWCYHVGTEYHASLGLLHLQVSVLKGQEQACIEEIHRQMEALQQGKIDEGSFEQMKKSVLGEILSLQDQMVDSLFRASHLYAQEQRPLPLKVLYRFVEELKIEDFAKVGLPLSHILTYCGQGVEFEL